MEKVILILDGSQKNQELFLEVSKEFFGKIATKNYDGIKDMNIICSDASNFKNTKEIVLFLRNVPRQFHTTLQEKFENVYNVLVINQEEGGNLEYCKILNTSDVNFKSNVKNMFDIMRGKKF